MTILYPSALPQYFTRDLTGSPFMPRTRFESEAGDHIDIPIGSAAHDFIRCSLILTRDEFRMFANWVRYELKNGTLPFLGPHPLFRDQCELKFSEMPEPYEYAFFTPLEIRVTMTLRVRELT